MTITVKLKNKDVQIYTASSPTFIWKDKADNIVTSKTLIQKLNEKAAADSKKRREQISKTN